MSEAPRLIEPEAVPCDDLRCESWWQDVVPELTIRCDLPRGHDGQHRADRTWKP